MATELDVSKSRRFDIAMSRRTRRSTSLVACFQDQYVPPLTQRRHQVSKLKTLFQYQDTDLQGLQQCEDAEQRLYEDEELKIPEAPLQYEGNEQKTPEQYQDEQEKKLEKYFDEGQKKQEQRHDEEVKKLEQYLDVEKTPEKYQYVDEKTSEYQDEDQTSPKQNEEDVEEKIPEQYQDEEEQKAPQQCEDADEHASEQYEEEEEQKAQQESHNMEQKTSKQRPGVKNLPLSPGVGDGMPRFSLQELIQEKQLPIREAKSTDRLGGHWENGLFADHKVSGGGATGGATLAMVIKRPEGGKKSMGMIRRCVKALNQMIKAKHGSKKNVHL